MKPALLLLAAALVCPGIATGSDFSDADAAAAKAASNRYFAAWRTNDAEKIMAVFTAEPVLSPSGIPWIHGADNARAFWFPPDSAPAVVNAFEPMVIEVDGSGDLAFVRGTFTLSFDYDGKTYDRGGKYVSIVRRQADGEWRITHQIWDDYPSD